MHARVLNHWATHLAFSILRYSWTHSISQAGTDFKSEINWLIDSDQSESDWFQIPTQAVGTLGLFNIILSILTFTPAMLSSAHYKVLAQILTNLFLIISQIFFHFDFINENS